MRPRQTSVCAGDSCCTQDNWHKVTEGDERKRRSENKDIQGHLEHVKISSCVECVMSAFGFCYQFAFVFSISCYFKLLLQHISGAFLIHNIYLKASLGRDFAGSNIWLCDQLVKYDTLSHI